jgi:peroxiredoxin Q/BCP
LAKVGAQVVGMSGDTVEELQRFRDKYQLNFPLVSDTSHKTLAAYGVWQEKNMYGRKTMGVVRTTYIIAPDGRIKHVFPKVKVDGHLQEVVKALKS